jgi:transcriptional regulator with XRE-family HTH domain
MPYGTNLKRLRKAKGFTQEEMAKRLDIAQSTYCQFETNAKSPNIYLAQEIAKILGCTLDQMMKGV